MSGGSGSRVNSYTMRVIDQLQHYNQVLDDHAFYQQPSDVGPYDLVWDREQSPDPPPIEPHDFNFLEQPEQLNPYDSMPPGTFKRTVVYDRTLPMNLRHEKLARSITCETFFPQGYSADLNDALLEIETRSNFQIMKIATVQNKAQYDMHEMFRQAYGIVETRRNFHGSDLAATISEEGFRSAMCLRALHGRGIYSASGVWEAISYCDADTITVLLVSVHVGPHTVGFKNQEDFGTNPNGKPYLTLTNIAQTIFCSKYEAQLLPFAEITLRYMHENKHTNEHQKFVRYYSAALWARIAESNYGVVPAALAPAPAAPVAPLQWVDQPHHFWVVGREVTVVKPFNLKFVKFVDCRGVLERSVVRGNKWLFFVKPTHDRHGTPINVHDVARDILALNEGTFRWVKDKDRGLLPCKMKHISFYYTPSVQLAGAAGKRPADDKPDDQQAAKQPRLDP